ncbi:MAG: TorF family putative porin [Rubrivivax sp.]|jgi:uncharacterized protein (TIGR02001 family)|nr:TorF family putative porin [Rubrivivax sp.]
MHKRITALGVAALLAATAMPSHAQDWTFTGNAGLYSDYRFRGISQTNKYPAFQGGFDLAHASGFYLGNWNSNIDSSFFGGSNLEMDFYGGFRGSAGDFSYDLGLIYYYYPGSDPDIDNTELYVGMGWGPLALKYSYAVSDFFSLPDSDGSWYLDAKATFPLTKELSAFARVGYQSLEGGAQVVEIGGSGPNDSITDWAIGITYDLSGWMLGASYIGTNRDLENAARPGRNISGDTFVVSIGKSF